MRIDLIEWTTAGPGLGFGWWLGRRREAAYAPEAANEAIAETLRGDADFLLMWDPALGPPPADRIRALAVTGDVIHAGLRVGTRNLPPELDLIHAEWSAIDPADETRATSWRISPRCCLVATGLLRSLGALDPSFRSMEMAGLEAGFRWLRRGAIVWYDPRLLPGSDAARPAEAVPVEDHYLFLCRNFKPVWSKYVLMRRSLATGRPRRDRAAFRAAQRAAVEHPAPPPGTWQWPPDEGREAPWARARVSVIIPTLGRYAYLPGALESLRRQSIRPIEVVIVDQNRPDERRPEVYEPFVDLGLNVIWQDERGQSLARNTALAATSGDHIYLFDDDSIAAPDVLEQHLRIVLRYGADASTGVAYPPPPEQASLPQEFRFLRVAQTFDTGNALLTRRALAAVGGLDRAFDHGVNTDLDFGTRLYLAGGLIIHNPLASRIHYKAPSGGLRTYGSWWAHATNGALRPFPAPTQVYYMLRYLSPRQRRERMRLLALLALRPQTEERPGAAPGRPKSLWQSAGLLASLPLRMARARAAGRNLLRAGPRIPSGQPERLAPSLESPPHLDGPITTQEVRP